MEESIALSVQSRRCKQTQLYWRLCLSVRSVMDVACVINGQPTGDIIKIGQCTKQGHFLKNWKLRWFALTATRLYYLKDWPSNIAKGEINLSNVTGVEQVFKREQCARFIIECFPQLTKAGTAPRSELRTRISTCTAATQPIQWNGLRRSDRRVPFLTERPRKSADPCCARHLAVRSASRRMFQPLMTSTESTTGSSATDGFNHAIDQCVDQLSEATAPDDVIQRLATLNRRLGTVRQPLGSLVQHSRTQLCETFEQLQQYVQSALHGIFAMSLAEAAPRVTG